MTKFDGRQLGGFVIKVIKDWRYTQKQGCAIGAGGFGKAQWETRSSNASPDDEFNYQRENILIRLSWPLRYIEIFQPWKENGLKIVAILQCDFTMHTLVIKFKSVLRLITLPMLRMWYTHDDKPINYRCRKSDSFLLTLPDPVFSCYYTVPIEHKNWIFASEIFRYHFEKVSPILIVQRRKN